MPIYEFECQECGKFSEIIVFGSADSPKCRYCGSQHMKKRLSAHSSMSGPSKNRMPGLGDTACCGSSPGHAAGCAGPGSCCGKNFSG
jgi:putative FmdB family regulatory protein